MVASDNIVGENQYVIFRQILIPSGNSLLRNPSKLAVRRVTKEDKFYSKYLDWGCVNKWAK